MIIIGLLILYTQTLQSLTKDRMGGPAIRNYSDLGFACFGQAGKFAVDVCILIGYIMLVTGFLVVIGT